VVVLAGARARDADRMGVVAFNSRSSRIVAVSEVPDAGAAGAPHTEQNRLDSGNSERHVRQVIMRKEAAAAFFNLAELALLA
jgi:hypothetical protein